MGKKSKKDRPENSGGRQSINTETRFLTEAEKEWLRQDMRQALEEMRSYLRSRDSKDQK